MKSLCEGKDYRVILFALESLHLPEAKPIRDSSVLLGAMEGSMAYEILGRGTKYSNALCQMGTIYSQKLVSEVATTQGISKDSIIYAQSNEEYWKIINFQPDASHIFCTKTPFGAIEKSQSPDISPLYRKPIRLGVFANQEAVLNSSGRATLQMLVKVLNESLRLLLNPWIYTKAVFKYIHDLPEIDPAFKNVKIIQKIKKCKPNSHQSVDELKNIQAI